MYVRLCPSRFGTAPALASVAGVAPDVRAPPPQPPTIPAAKRKATTALTALRRWHGGSALPLRLPSLISSPPSESLERSTISDARRWRKPRAAAGREASRRLTSSPGAPAGQPAPLRLHTGPAL